MRTNDRKVELGLRYTGYKKTNAKVYCRGFIEGLYESFQIDNIEFKQLMKKFVDKDFKFPNKENRVE